MIARRPIPAFATLAMSSSAKHITHDDLRRHYDVIFYATGAQSDRRLGIPGEDLPNSLSATEFVAWYNGHPDFPGSQPRSEL